MHPFKSNKPTVSLVMIVKDEEAYLHDCLESVKDIVDEMVIVDTGSSDNTIQLARQFGAKILHYEWDDDFSAARNEGLRHAACDWILQIDADERVPQESKAELKKWLRNSSVTCVSVVIDSPTAEQKKGHISRAHRLFRNLPGIRYSGRIHEQISPSVVAMRGREGQSSVRLLHLGYAKDGAEMQAKSDRNYRLLQRQVEDEPGNPYPHFTLAQNLTLRQEYDSALKHLNRALELGGLPTDIICSIHNNFAELHMRKGDYHDAISSAERALAITKQQTTAYLLLNEIYGYLRDVSKQIRCLQSAIDVVERQQRAVHSVSLEAYVDPAMLYLNLGQRYVETNDPAAALVNFRKAFEIDSENQSVITALTDALIQVGNFDDAATVLEGAVKTAASLEKLAWIYLKREDFANAISTYETLLEIVPRNVQILKRLAALYNKLGESVKARDYLAQAARASASA